MKFHLIDYSGKYYGKPSDRNMPVKRRGKFIQIRNKSDEYLVLSPKEMSSYHANIAERFFLSLGIVGEYNYKRDVYTVTEPDWTIVGGGMWKLDENAKTLDLYGSSLAYGHFAGRGLRKRLCSLPGMESYSITVE